MQQHRSSPRLHRFPHRIDYTLIPAPLDLSLPLKTEKDALPAIIVTPSSPSSARDFHIAFLAPPPKPSVRERLGSLAPFTSPFQRKARTLLILSLIFFVLICHVVTHRLAARRPHIEFSVQTGDAHLVESSFGNWVIRSIWGEDGPDDVKREFIVNDTLL
ncbi:hypothetical protein B0H15DRAFT_843150 [Mycena belliarum]|uniref:Uncharacterized protein n=1 Tax=Mycena belliarum TaxID=1033014 RepID=A0AAD6U7D8_9AGAR|nr:hypothetical protein B0H15DRAFT_843150 [Mycena belliae]